MAAMRHRGKCRHFEAAVIGKEELDRKCNHPGLIKARTEEVFVLTKTIEEKTVRQGWLAVEAEKMKSEPSRWRGFSRQVRSWVPTWMAVAPSRRQCGRISGVSEPRNQLPFMTRSRC